MNTNMPWNGGEMRFSAKIGSAIFALILGSTQAIAQSFMPALQQAIEGARKEGALTLSYGSAHDGAQGAERLRDRINKKYGTNLKFTFAPGPSGPEMAARIAQEAAAGKAASTDIFFTSMTNENARLFEEIDWRDYLPDLPAEAMKYNKHGVAFATLLIGITYNTALVSPDKAPQALTDLLKPEWKGKVAARVSTTFMAYLALPEVLGPEGAVDFFRKLGAQADGQIRCGSSERISSGEFLAFFPDCGDYEARKGQRTGAPLGHIIPREAGGVAVWPIGIPRNSAHPNAARLFVTYMLSREGQDFLWDSDATDYWRLPGSRIAPEMDKYRARGVNFIDQTQLESDRPDLLNVQAQMFQALQQGLAK